MSNTLSKAEIRRFTNSYLRFSGSEYENIKNQINNIGSFDLIKNIWDKLNYGEYPKEKYQDFFTLFSLINKDQINNLLVSHYSISNNLLLDPLVFFMSQSRDTFFIPWLIKQHDPFDFWQNYFTMKAVYQIGTTDAIKYLVEDANFYYYDSDEHKNSSGNLVSIMIDSAVQMKKLYFIRSQISPLALSPMLPLEIIEHMHPLIQHSQLLIRRSLFITNLCKIFGVETLESLWLFSPTKNNYEGRNQQLERNLFISFCLSNLDRKSDETFKLIISIIKQYKNNKGIGGKEILYTIFAYDLLLKYRAYCDPLNREFNELVESGIYHPNLIISRSVISSILYNNVYSIFEQIQTFLSNDSYFIHPIVYNAIVFGNEFSQQLLWKFANDDDNEIRQLTSMHEKLILDQLSPSINAE